MCPFYGIAFPLVVENLWHWDVTKKNSLWLSFKDLDKLREFTWNKKKQYHLSHLMDVKKPNQKFWILMCGSYGAGSEKKHVFYRVNRFVSDVGWKTPWRSSATGCIGADLLRVLHRCVALAPWKFWGAVAAVCSWGASHWQYVFFVRTVCLCTSLVWSDWEASHRQFGFALSCSSLNEGGKVSHRHFSLAPKFWG